MIVRPGPPAVWWTLLLLITSVSSGCVADVASPGTVSVSFEVFAPPTVLDNLTEVTPLSQGTGWTAASFVLPKTSWRIDDAGRSSATLASRAPGARFNEGATLLFEVDERVLQYPSILPGLEWNRSLFSAEPRDIEYLAVFVVENLTAPSKVMVAVTTGEGTFPAAESSLGALAAGRQVRVAHFDWNPEETVPDYHGIDYSDTRKPTGAPGVWSDGAVSIHAEATVGVGGVHPSSFAMAAGGPRVGEWSILHEVDETSRRDSGRFADLGITGGSVSGRSMLRGNSSAEDFVVRVDTPDVMPRIWFRAVSIAWPGIEARYDVAETFEVSPEWGDTEVASFERKGCLPAIDRPALTT